VAASGRSLHSGAYEEFRRRLIRARQQAGLTQVQVANRLARPQSYISKCESGERRVDVIELSEFAEIYRKPLSFFVPKKPQV
jgi:transcriptional regulator with XRE-family HTH domain